MSDALISDNDLVLAATNLFAAPVRGATASFVGKGDLVAIVVDGPGARMGRALQVAAHALGAEPLLVTLDRSAGPLKVLPDDARAALVRSQASVFAARAPYAERSMREQIASLVRANKCRHARLTDVTDRAFARGIAVPVTQTVSAGRDLYGRVKGARLVEVTSPAGTDLHVSVTPATWADRVGEIVAGQTVTFPAGTLFTTPDAIDGVFVADASLGEFFGEREGLLTEKQVRFEIEAGRVVSVSCPGAPALESEIRATLALSENSNRVGLVAIGVNPGVTCATGDASVDQTMPGLHLGLGDPGGKSTVASFSARTAFPACESASRVVVDGRVVVDSGVLAAESR